MTGRPAPQDDGILEADAVRAVPDMQVTRCPVCGGRMARGRHAWLLRCQACGFRGSTLRPTIGETRTAGSIDEDLRAGGLERLRRDNFERLLDRLCRRIEPSGARLLDVGCAHGWFIEECAGTFDASGIEPDLTVSEGTRRRGLPVRTGYFPDALESGERFDVITFNDVLEHIPSIDATMDACHRHLTGQGLLVVNAPSRQGTFYRISRLLVRLGIRGPFERMWQVGFPSPHVHYFDTATMSRIAADHGFVVESRSTLPSISVKGLYSRIRYSRDVSAVRAGILASLIAVASPVLRLFPADINVWVLRRGAQQARTPTR